MFNKKKEDHEEICGFLGPETEVHGELRFTGAVRLDGRFQGNVTSQGTLIIGETGNVQADVRAQTIVVSGRIEGKAQAEQKIEILKTGKIYGDVATPRLVIQEGGILEGNCTMLSEEAPSLAKSIEEKTVLEKKPAREAV
ncbi:MAG: polymer-forming cytoskeletal protein [Acidobacteria bacterium]|nr:polymer-forming cytoskeletal protein [Acidobacteriota bacterium]